MTAEQKHVVPLTHTETKIQKTKVLAIERTAHQCYLQLTVSKFVPNVNVDMKVTSYIDGLGRAVVYALYFLGQCNHRAVANLKGSKDRGPAV